MLVDPGRSRKADRPRATNLFRGQCRALAEVLQAAVDPELGEFFLDAVLREAVAQGVEILPRPAEILDF
jgi:hypothetical protein